MLFNTVLMVTLIISAALSAALTTGVCLWAYHKGKADGMCEGLRAASKDMMALMNATSMFMNSRPSFCAPKDEEFDQLINALKDSHTSCTCKQNESSQS